MKKILFSLIFVLTFVGIVNAKPQVEYDWGEYLFGEHLLSVGEINGNIATFTYSGSDDVYYALFDKNGNILFEQNNLKGSFYVVNNQIVYLDYLSNNVCYQAVLDQELNLLKENEVSGCSYFHNDSRVGENDKYYYIDENIFYKSNNELVDLDEYVENHELFNQFLDYYEEGNYSKSYEVLFNIFKEEFKGTYLPSLYYIESVSDQYFVDAYVNEKGESAVIYWKNLTNRFGLKIFDVDHNEIASFMLDSLTEPKVVFKDGYVYVVEVDGEDLENDEEEEFSLKTILSQYDLGGNKIYSIDLNNISDCRMCYGSKFVNRNVHSFIHSKEGLYIFTDKRVYEEGMDSVINEDEEISGVSPTIQKFSLVYEIETKDSEHGTLKVDKELSKNGDKITYTVEPKEGYKLDKVIVTDENGNTIEIKDSSFTMPSANVTIEAIFVVENPNTGVFINVGCACIVALISYYYIVQKNFRVKQYE